MLWRLGVVVFSFATSLGVLYLLARWTAVQAHDDYDGGDDQHNKLYFPSNLVELKDVVNVLSSISIYKVLPLFSAAYVFKQTFASKLTTHNQQDERNY